MLGNGALLRARSDQFRKYSILAVARRLKHTEPNVKPDFRNRLVRHQLSFGLCSLRRVPVNGEASRAKDSDIRLVLAHGSKA